MSNLDCIIVDDDALSRKILSKHIESIPYLNLVDEADNAKKAYEIILTKKVDLIFLDVMMPEMSGIEFLSNYQNLPQIILVTSDKMHASQGFDHGVTDFLVKPVEENRFTQASLKAQKIFLEIQKEQPDDFIYVKKDNVLVKLNTTDITHIEALSDYVNLYTIENKRFTTLSTMKKMETRLPENYFIRIHRSFIVNLNHVVSIEGNAVKMSSQNLPISRTYKEELMNRVKRVKK